MKITKWILGIFVILSIIICAYLAYMGYFTKIIISEKEMGPYTLAFVKYVGPYSKTGKVFDQLYNSLKNDGINSTTSIGIYYDNPKYVKQDSLRTDCGIIINETSMKNNNISKYDIKTINRALCMVADFPIKDKMSYMIGAMKVYPYLEKYTFKHNIKPKLVYEIYDMPAKKIYYVMQI